MKHIKSIIFYLSFFFFLTAYSQNKENPGAEGSNFLKKGNFAVMFELGKLIDRSTFFEGYNISTKYHIVDNTALRFNFNIGEGNIDDDGPISDYSELSSYDIEINLCMQQYFKKNTFVNPFITLGILYAKNHENLTRGNIDFLRWNDEWSIGVGASMGAEIFIYNNVSIIGEFIFKGTYKKSRFRLIYNNSIQLDSEEKTYSFSANTARLGFSVYF
jgi:hypothetical protein